MRWIRFTPRGNSVQGKLRMRKLNTKTAVPLDVVPERRAKRCPPRFRSANRFCDLSPGREGEISRPLDHMWQIPFIHSTRFKTNNNFYIYIEQFSSCFPHVVRSSVHIRKLRMRACKETSFKFQVVFLYGSRWSTLAQNRWICACTFAEHTKQAIISCYPFKVFLPFFVNALFFYLFASLFPKQRFVFSILTSLLR